MKKLSTLFFAAIAAFTVNAQIPNAGFETWTNHAVTPPYDTPDGWSTADSALNALAPGTPYTCAKSTPGAVGTYYIKLTSVTVPILGVLPGIAASGKLAVAGTSLSASGGFAYASRPANLIGQWQYTPAGSDNGSISVLLTKWNGTTRDTISYTNYTMSGTVSAWTAFSIPLTYMHGSNPDTAIIIMLSGQPGGTAGSTISIDDLGFSGSVPNGVVTVNNPVSAISLFPNPASVYTNISYSSKTAGPVKISVVGINGKSVKDLNFTKVRGENGFPIDISNIAVGTYFIKIMDDQGTTVRKIAIE